MAKFHPIAPKFDAFQFVTGVENTRSLADGLRANGSDWAVLVHEEHIQVDVTTENVTTNVVPEKLHISSTSGEAHVVDLGEWILVAPDGYVEVLSNDEFSNRYTAI